MDVDRLIAATGVIVLGVLFYSYSCEWLRRWGRHDRYWRGLLNGLAFGALSVLLMRTGIQVAEGVFIDTRVVPVALIGLFEGWPAGLVAAAVNAAARVWQGGTGALAGVVVVLVGAVAGGLVHQWARHDGRVGPRHALALAGVVSLGSLGAVPFLPDGAEILGRVWLPYLVAVVVGIAFFARLLHDVAQRERLATEQERFRAIIDEASDAIRIVDADSFRILEANRADAELSGCSREELIGMDSRGFWPEEPEARARWEALIAEERAHGFARAFALPYRTRAGRVVLVDSTRRLVVHGGRRYRVVVFRDATDRQAAEAARREAAELRAIAALANAAAHEINNPLAALVGSLELLEKRLPVGAQETRWIDRARGAGRRIQEIVVRMQRVTRVETMPTHEGLPEILDIRRSSATGAPRPPGDSEGSS